LSLMASTIDQRMALHVQQTPLGVIEWDTDFRVTDWNPAAERIFGYSREEALGKHPAGLILPQEVRAVIDEIWQQLLEQRGGTRSTNDNVTKDGRLIHCEWYNTPLIDESGNVVAVASLVQDVTDKVRAENALKQSQQMLRQVLDTIPVQVYWKDQEMRYLGCNASFAEHAGLDAVDEVVGLSDDDCPWAESSADIKDVDHRVISTGVSQIAFDQQITDLSGNLRWLRTSKIPLRNSRQDIIGLLGIDEDITHRKTYERRLRNYTALLKQSNRELQDFAFVASHDLQEPLRKVVVFGDRLRKLLGGVMDDNADDYLRRMQSAASRMQNLINDLLAYSRIATNGRAFSPTDLSEVLRGVLGDLEIAIRESGANIEAEVLPVVDADPMQMRQLLQNLLSNSMKFRKPNRPLNIKISSEMSSTDPDLDSDDEATGAVVRLVVEDNGIGFDPKYAEKIFIVFQRLQGRDTHAGTGIGLSICRRIVDRHGGRISAESRPGEGARFIVRLPLSQAQGEIKNGF